MVALHPCWYSVRLLDWISRTTLALHATASPVDSIALLYVFHRLRWRSDLLACLVALLTLQLSLWPGAASCLRDICAASRVLASLTGTQSERYTSGHNCYLRARDRQVPPVLA